jgi:CBS-domain-containing membrane protein
VSHRDLTPVLLESEFDAETTEIREFLDDDVVTVAADEGVYDLLDLFSDQGIRRAPVVDEAGELVGIISVSDIVVLLGMELQHVANTIRSSSPAYERAGPDLYDRQ